MKASRIRNGLLNKDFFLTCKVVMWYLFTQLCVSAEILPATAYCQGDTLAPVSLEAGAKNEAFDVLAVRMLVLMKIRVLPKCEYSVSVVQYLSMEPDIFS